MCPIGIGKFIASRRKQSNMTQMELAEKVGVTNRAVSKWETGKSIPDVSIMLELCEILNISVNELLRGKKLNISEEKEEAEQHTLTMLVAKNELENFQILTEILIFAGIAIATTLTSIFAVTTLQKIITLLIGGFVWGYGLWMRIKIKKAIKKIN
ncbi:helix-turn-helix domain-containing protein [Vagococcus elongatus]|uniref:DNA-binding protein n=1 Tax=Vagococcus elongatus TaxID=180344 RepID=A0A430AUX8_9ENTE|nr:helix-turn-helix transcriptional regulator [Vagococcus elongatus]RSU11862.1 DNA-binding protein [Vagococcus elongatus]